MDHLINLALLPFTSGSLLVSIPLAFVFSLSLFMLIGRFMRGAF